MLNNWCSDIGKAGHCAILDLWYMYDPRFNSTQEHAEYVTKQLDGLCFIYKYPDSAVSLVNHTELQMSNLFIIWLLDWTWGFLLPPHFSCIFNSLSKDLFSSLAIWASDWCHCACHNCSKCDCNYYNIRSVDSINLELSRLNVV